MSARNTQRGTAIEMRRGVGVVGAGLVVVMALACVTVGWQLLATDTTYTSVREAFAQGAPHRAPLRDAGGRRTPPSDPGVNNGGDERIQVVSTTDYRWRREQRRVHIDLVHR